MPPATGAGRMTLSCRRIGSVGSDPLHWHHADHGANVRVLERGNLRFEALLPRHAIFPNLGAAEPQDVRCFAAVEVDPGKAHRQRLPQSG